MFSFLAKWIVRIVKTQLCCESWGQCAIETLILLDKAIRVAKGRNLFKIQDWNGDCTLILIKFSYIWRLISVCKLAVMEVMFNLRYSRQNQGMVSCVYVDIIWTILLFNLLNILSKFVWRFSQTKPPQHATWRLSLPSRMPE